METKFLVKRINSLNTDASRAPLIIETYRILGEGSFGKVYKGYSENMPSEILAIKQIPREMIETKEFNESVENEINVMKKLEHENIVKLKGARFTEKNIYIITEFCPDGTLFSIKSSLTIPQTLICMKQIVEGVMHAHSKNIIHRDLKPANIMLDNGILKICDFGFARFVNDLYDELKMSCKKGTYNYMAPEVFYGEEYNSKCDVWSLGVIFYELIYKMLPWSGGSVKEMFSTMKTCKLQFPDIVDYDEDIRDLISKMMEINIEKRFDLQNVRNHKVFQRKIPNILKI